MGSLLELITLTKGIEYLLAIAFLLAFLGFWQWQQHRGPGLLVRVLPVALLAGAVGALTSTCVGLPATATPSLEKSLGVEEAHYLANIYGPAKFAAHEMSPEVVSCQTCHHNSPQGQTLPCSSCHTDPSAGSSPEKPGLKAAYHRKCIDCHQEAFTGPLKCIKCHSESPASAEFKKASPSPVIAPSLPHSLPEGNSSCLACHNPEGQLPLPGNHASYRASVVCLGCHKPPVRTS